MAQLTRVQLIDQLAASHVAYAKLEERLAAALALAQRPAASYRSTRAQPRPVRPLSAAVMAAHATYTETLSRARELAIRTGKAVRVGGA